MIKALERTEAVSSDSHPRVAPPLLLLSECYIRTQRFTLAEGLYRRSLQMLGFVGGSGEMAVASSHRHKVPGRRLPCQATAIVINELPSAAAVALSYAASALGLCLGFLCSGRAPLDGVLLWFFFDPLCSDVVFLTLLLMMSHPQ